MKKVKVQEMIGFLFHDTWMLDSFEQTRQQFQIASGKKEILEILQENGFPKITCKFVIMEIKFEELLMDFLTWKEEKEAFLNGLEQLEDISNEFQLYDWLISYKREFFLKIKRPFLILKLKKLPGFMQNEILEIVFGK